MKDETRQRVAGIMASAQPAVARVMVNGSGNVVVGGDVHLYSAALFRRGRRNAADVAGLMASLDVLNGEQLSRVSKFVAALRGGH